MPDVFDLTWRNISIKRWIRERVQPDTHGSMSLTLLHEECQRNLGIEFRVNVMRSMLWEAGNLLPSPRPGDEAYLCKPR